MSRFSDYYGRFMMNQFTNTHNTAKIQFFFLTAQSATQLVIFPATLSELKSFFRARKKESRKHKCLTSISQKVIVLHTDTNVLRLAFHLSIVEWLDIYIYFPSWMYLLDTSALLTYIGFKRSNRYMTNFKTVLADWKKHFDLDRHRNRNVNRIWDCQFSIFISYPCVVL